MQIFAKIGRLVDNHIETSTRRHSRQVLLSMTDRELNDIGLPREQVYACPSLRTHRRRLRRSAR